VIALADEQLGRRIPNLDTPAILFEPQAPQPIRRTQEVFFIFMNQVLIDALFSAKTTPPPRRWAIV